MFTSTNAPADMRSVILGSLAEKLETYTARLRASIPSRLLALKALQRQLAGTDVAQIAGSACAYREQRRETEAALSLVLEIGEISARRYTEATTPGNAEKVAARAATVRFGVSDWTVNDAHERAGRVLAVLDLDRDVSRFTLVALADAIDARLGALDIKDGDARGVVRELRARANDSEFRKLAALIADAGDLARDTERALRDESQIVNAADSALRRRSPDADARDVIHVQAFWEG